MLARATTGILGATLLAGGLAGCSVPLPDGDGAGSTVDASNVTVGAVEGSSTSTAMSRWTARTATVFRTVSTDVAAVSRAGVKPDLPALLTRCTALQKDVVAARKVALPSPESDVDRAVQEGLNYYATAASQCVSGARSGDAATLNKAAASLTTANRYAAIVKASLA